MPEQQQMMLGLEATEMPNGKRCVPPGCGPVGETCGTCRHLYRLHYRDYTYLKCGLMQAQWTSGRGSDIRPSGQRAASGNSVCWA